MPVKTSPNLLRNLSPCADGRRLSGWDGFVFAVSLLLLRLSTLADINATFEESAVFNGNASGDDVTGQRAVAANVDAITGGEIAADLAEHNDLTGIDVGGDD